MASRINGLYSAPSIGQWIAMYETLTSRQFGQCRPGPEGASEQATLATARIVIAAELMRRNSEAFNAWMDSGQVESPRPFFEGVN